jgi:hypothetical protein
MSQVANVANHKCPKSQMSQVTNVPSHIIHLASLKQKGEVMHIKKLTRISNGCRGLNLLRPRDIHLRGIDGTIPTVQHVGPIPCGRPGGCRSGGLVRIGLVLSTRPTCRADPLRSAWWWSCGRSGGGRSGGSRLGNYHIVVVSRFVCTIGISLLPG